MTQPADAWIAALFAPSQVDDGPINPPRPLIQLTGDGAPSVADDPANARTVWNFGAGAGTPIPHLVSANYTVLETKGNIVVVVRGQAGPITIKATISTAPPTVGMQITIKVADTNFSETNSITFDGNGESVEYEGATASTFLMKPSIVGIGPSITWMWDGTDWVSM